MPDEKTLLAQTVAAASELIKGGKGMKKIKAAITRQMAEERLANAATLTGATAPDDET